MVRAVRLSQLAHGDTGPRLTPGDWPSPCGMLNFRSKLIRLTRWGKGGPLVGAWCFATSGASQLALLSGHPGPLPPIQHLDEIAKLKGTVHLRKIRIFYLVLNRILA